MEGEHNPGDDEVERFIIALREAGLGQGLTLVHFSTQT
jgi:hypothetical protein